MIKKDALKTRLRLAVFFSVESEMIFQFVVPFACVGIPYSAHDLVVVDLKLNGIACSAEYFVVVCAGKLGAAGKIHFPDAVVLRERPAFEAGHVSVSGETEYVVVFAEYLIHGVVRPVAFAGRGIVKLRIVPRVVRADECGLAFGGSKSERFVKESVLFFADTKIGNTQRLGSQYDEIIAFDDLIVIGFVDIQTEHAVVIAQESVSELVVIAFAVAHVVVAAYGDDIVGDVRFLYGTVKEQAFDVLSVHGVVAEKYGGIVAEGIVFRIFEDRSKHVVARKIVALDVRIREHGNTESAFILVQYRVCRSAVGGDTEKHEKRNEKCGEFSEKTDNCHKTISSFHFFLLIYAEKTDKSIVLKNLLTTR